MTLRFSPPRGGSAISISSYLRGPTGPGATIAVGTVTPLTPGATPTVSNSGSSSAATLDFGIPTSATLAAGTTTTKAAGTSATVTDSGTSSAHVFDFGIPKGADSGAKYAFESSTSMAAPASGGLRGNNATLASVSAIAVNASDAGGVDISDWIAAWDDSTNTAKGSVVLRKEGSGAVEYVFTITSVTDNTSWLQINVTYVSGSGSLSAADPVYLTPYITGNKGADGAGTGDFSSNTSSSVDSEVVLFSGTGGKTGKRASATGIAVLTSGVLSASTTSTVATLGTIELGAASDTTISRSSAGVIAVEGVTVPLNGTSQVATFGTIELGAASDTTISRSSAGVIAVEGVTVPLNGTSQVATFGTIELGAASDTTISRTGAGAIAVEGVGVALNSTSLPHTASQFEVGAASDTTISRASAGVIAVEGVNLTPNIPQSSKSLDYTLVLGDANTHIYETGASKTITIPANASVAFPIGTAVTFVSASNAVTIAITSDTMTLASAGTTGSRTLAANSIATALKITSTSWIISGAGLT